MDEKLSEFRALLVDQAHYLDADGRYGEAQTFLFLLDEFDERFNA